MFAALEGPEEIAMWKCPKCKREFTRENQRHSCGIGSKEEVLRNRPDSVINCYNKIEKIANNLGKVEIVAKDRYVLFRSKRIFIDLSIMKDCVRIAIHLEKRVNKPYFIKIVPDEKGVTHVVKVKTEQEIAEIELFIEEAYKYSLSR